MDIITIHKNAERVAGIFRALAMVVLAVGIASAVIVLIGGFLSASSGDQTRSILLGIATALIIAVYTAVTWAGVQLAALVAGYIQIRTGATVQD